MAFKGQHQYKINIDTMEDAKNIVAIAININRMIFIVLFLFKSFFKIRKNISLSPFLLTGISIFKLENSLTWKLLKNP